MIWGLSCKLNWAAGDAGRWAAYLKLISQTIYLEAESISDGVREAGRQM